MTQYRHQNDPIYNLDHPQHIPLPLHLVAPIHHPFAFILKSSKPGTSISSAPQQEYTASQFSKHQRMTTQYLPGHFILVDFNLVPKRQELCLVKVVLWKTTFHTSSEMKTENKKDIYRKLCLPNHASRIMASSPTPPLPSHQIPVSVFYSGISQDSDPRLPGDPALDCNEPLHGNQELSQQSSVNTNKVSRKGDLLWNEASRNNQLFTETNGLALLSRYFHSKGT